MSTTFTFANTWLAWRLGGFQVEHPDLSVRLLTGNQLVDLASGEADVAIRAGARPWPGLDCSALMAVDFSPMAAPSFVVRSEAALGRSLRPDDGRLIQPFALTATAGFRDWLVSAPGRRNLPKIKRFREWLVDRTAAERKAS